MKIDEAVSKALNEGKYIYRKTFEAHMNILPTNTEDCCILIPQNSDLVRKGWNPTANDLMADDWEIERGERLITEQKVAEHKPPINYLDRILVSEEAVETSRIAADYGMSVDRFRKTLEDLHVKKEIAGQRRLCREHRGKGYTKSYTTSTRRPDGTIKRTLNMRWTQKGRLFLYDLLKEEGYTPAIDLLEEDNNE